MNILGNTGALGKDLFDLDRPYTHTKIHFGDEQYWFEYNPTPMPYGATLMLLLQYDAREYLRCVEKLKSAMWNHEGNAEGGTSQNGAATAGGSSSRRRVPRFPTALRLPQARR